MFRFFIERGIILTVAILIVCVIGIVSIFRVPVQMIPDLQVTTISIVTQWPGATPQDIEKEIIIEQEDYLRSIPGLRQMTSEAGTGEGSIELEFSPGIDVQETLIKVNNALAQVPSYPENVDEPRIQASSFSDNAFIYYAVQPLDGNPKEVDIESRRDFVEDHVQTELERVPGVSEARVGGGANRQVRIYVDPAKLAKRQITVSQLRQALRQRNVDVSGGDIDSGKRRYLLRTLGRFQSIEAIEELVIAQRENTLIRLRHVGHAELAHSEIRSYTHSDGKPSISVSIRRQLGANVIEIKDRVSKAVERLNDGVLQENGLTMRLSNDDVQYVKDAIALVRRNLILGSLLACGVLFLFLRSISTTLLGALGIPICTIAAFLGLLLMGRTINVISLAGIAFAIGMTLDNTIVVLENIHRHRLKGKSRFQAALDGVTEVWTALLASTLTTVFVFIPILFIELEAGQLYSDIAIAISASILMSMLVAITVIPSAASRLLRLPNDPEGKRPQSGRMTTYLGLVTLGESFTTAVTRILTWLMKGIWRRVGLILVILAVTFGIIQYLTPNAEYLPEGEESKIFSFMFPPPGYNLGEMTAIGRRFDRFFGAHIGEDPSRFAQGKSDVPAIETMFSRKATDSLMMIITVSSHNQVDDLVEIITKKFNEVPGMISFSSRGSIFSGNLGGTRSIDVDISGPELAPIFQTGSKAFARANEIFDGPQIRPQPSSLSLGQPLLEVRPKWARAAELGFRTDELGYQVWAFADGAYIDEFFLADDKIDMYLYSTEGTVQDPEDLNDLSLYSPGEGTVPLGAVATVEEEVNTETIRRVDSHRTVTLSIVPPRDVPLETAVQRVETDLIDHLHEQGSIPPNVRLEITGASDKLSATREALTGNFMIAIVISFLLMVAIFSHWGYPLIIMLSVPLGISGGIVGLWLVNHVGTYLGFLGIPDVNQPFDMITMLGFLVLIGTVVNNPILIVDQTVRRIREDGSEIKQAVIETTRSRIRPIMMSTITTIFGLSPLVFMPGAGTELYRGLGTIVLFGLLFSTVITLLFIPSLVSLLFQIRTPWTRAQKRACSSSPSRY